MVNKVLMVIKDSNKLRRTATEPTLLLNDTNNSQSNDVLKELQSLKADLAAVQKQQAITSPSFWADAIPHYAAPSTIKKTDY